MPSSALLRDEGVIAGLCSSEMTLSEMMSRAGKVPIQFDPGTQWQYGFSTDVLGRVTEVASGQSLDEFIAEKICDPLGMHDTSFIVPPAKRSRVVAAHVPDKTTITSMTFPTRISSLSKSSIVAGWSVTC
jgi:CubicO group peptidase (beta-lactamase class C family)